MVNETAARFGGIDILVNNAAIRHEAAIDALDYARWRAALATMLDGPFLCIKACLPHLRASPAGSIVNMGGMTARAGAKMRAHVIAAKAGLEGLTRALALELAEHDITVNCVSPGFIDTVRDAASSAAHRAGRALVLGRLGPPAEVAAMVRHLAGPHARFITGQVIHVNGGNYLGGEPRDLAAPFLGELGRALLQLALGLAGAEFEEQPRRHRHCLAEAPADRRAAVMRSQLRGSLSMCSAPPRLRSA